MQGKGYVSGVDWLDGGLVVVVDGVLRPCARGEMIRTDGLSRLDEVQGHMGIYGNRGYGKPQWVSYHEMQGMSGIWTRGNHI
ncbi:hypothetical protein N7541_004726 [Penicillium brevicompactum]|uniref:Uncharacterized protein n=1 Tax=Penicillium brevicompactum TaxID=5074 RepID=A0A9W9RHF5_PENBR|nr:hypothetical protein N7541_004726 [Penicillium brevicompactum]